MAYRQESQPRSTNLRALATVEARRSLASRQRLLAGEQISRTEPPSTLPELIRERATVGKSPDFDPYQQRSGATSDPLGPPLASALAHSARDGLSARTGGRSDGLDQRSSARPFMQGSRSVLGLLGEAAVERQLGR